MDRIMQGSLFDAGVEDHPVEALCGPWERWGSELVPGAGSGMEGALRGPKDVLAILREVTDLQAGIEWGGLSRSAVAAARRRVRLLQAGVVPPQTSIDDHRPDTPLQGHR